MDFAINSLFCLVSFQLLAYINTLNTENIFRVTIITVLK